MSAEEQIIKGFDLWLPISSGCYPPAWHSSGVGDDAGELARLTTKGEKMTGTDEQRARWAAEYEKNDQAKADFESADDFVAFMAADQSGRVRVHGSDRAEDRPVPRATVTEADRGEWARE